jgi:hypothetical protein
MQNSNPQTFLERPTSQAKGGRQQQRVLISMVVDAVPDHPYKARLLLASLFKYADVAPSDVLINLVRRIDTWLVNEFKALGCHVAVIEPYLDQTICNKLRQYHRPPEFVGDGLSGVLMLDLDFAVLEPIRLPNLNTVCGKIVDHGNPALDIFERVFQDQRVAAPAVVTADWGRSDTYATNLNGGVIYIPLAMIDTLGEATCRFAERLFLSSSNYQTPGFFIDQIAFALALAETQTPFEYLVSNDNFPTHDPTPPKNIQVGEAIRAIHYHHDIDAWGLVDPVLQDPLVQPAIHKINIMAARLENDRFYEMYKLGNKRKALWLEPKNVHEDKPTVHVFLRTTLVYERGGPASDIHEINREGWTIAFVLSRTYQNWWEAGGQARKEISKLAKQFHLRIYFEQPHHADLAASKLLENMGLRLKQFLRLSSSGRAAHGSMGQGVLQRLDVTSFLLDLREACPWAEIYVVREEEFQRSLRTCLKKALGEALSETWLRSLFGRRSFSGHVRMLIARGLYLLYQGTRSLRAWLRRTQGRFDKPINQLSLSNITYKDVQLLRFWNRNKLQPFDPGFWNK